MAGRARQDAAVGNGGNGGQRFTPKAHGADGFEIGQAADFAGGVAPERQRQFLAHDALAIVFDTDAPYAAGLQPQGDLGGASVQCVIYQFTHHGGRTLHHFACGDLADQLVW